MDEIIMKIQKYIDESLFEPHINWPKYEFLRRSYSRWAANEILCRILKESLKPPPYITGFEPEAPSAIIREFIDEMDYYSDISTDVKKQRIFIIAKETAIDINTFIFERRLA